MQSPTPTRKPKKTPRGLSVVNTSLVASASQARKKLTKVELNEIASFYYERYEARMIKHKDLREDLKSYGKKPSDSNM